MHDFDIREIFECAHLKFMVSGRSIARQIDRHMHAQCSHASVGLAQARPKKNTLKIENCPRVNEGVSPSKLNSINAHPQMNHYRDSSPAAYSVYYKSTSQGSHTKIM